MALTQLLCCFNSRDECLNLTVARLRHSPSDFCLKLWQTINYLDIISLADNSDVALEITFRATVDVVRISQHRPFVIKLMICAKHSPIISSTNKYVSLDVDLDCI